MEFYSFLITMGAIVALAFIGIGVCIGDSMAKGKSDECSDIRFCGVHVPDADNHLDRSDPPDPEEITIVLEAIRRDYHISLSERERAVLDYLIDKEGAENGEK